MAVELGKINTRSSYYLSESAASGFLIQSAIFYLYIYTGIRNTDRPAEPNYTLKRTSGTQRTVSVNISNIVNDYFNNTFDGNYSGETVFVDYKRGEQVVIQESTGSLFNQVADVAISKQAIAYYGYGYFEEGYNPLNNKLIMLDNENVVKLCGQPINIPIDTFFNENTTENLTSSFVKDGVEMFSSTYVLSADSEFVIENAKLEDFEDRVLNDGGTFEDSACLSSFETEYSIYDMDSLTITMGDESETISFTNVCECLYTPIKLTFYNKYGALQDFWFFKGGKTSISLENETFRRSLGSDDGSYNTYEHQHKSIGKLGNETMKLYSGFYPESYNETIRQLLLSEDVWATINDVVYPINIKTESHDFGTRIRDGIMTFDIEISLAYDKINKV